MWLHHVVTVQEASGAWCRAHLPDRKAMRMLATKICVLCEFNRVTTLLEWCPRPVVSASTPTITVTTNDELLSGQRFWPSALEERLRRRPRCREFGSRLGNSSDTRRHGNLHRKCAFHALSGQATRERRWFSVEKYRL